MNQQKKSKVGFPTILSEFLVQMLNAESLTGQVARSELQAFDIEKKYGPWVPFAHSTKLFSLIHLRRPSKTEPKWRIRNWKFMKEKQASQAQSIENTKSTN